MLSKLHEWIRKRRRDRKYYKRRRTRLAIESIEYLKDEGYTKWDTEDIFTPNEKEWLKEKTGCEIHEYSGGWGDPTEYVTFTW